VTPNIPVYAPLILWIVNRSPPSHGKLPDYLDLNGSGNFSGKLESAGKIGACVHLCLTGGFV